MDATPLEMMIIISSQQTQERMVTWVTKKKFEHKFEHSPKAYGLIKVTASKFSLPKVETMRKSYYLNDNIFKVKSVQEKLSNISLYIRNDYIKMKKKPYLETVTSKLV
jgi:hypothetical protein